MIHKCSLQYAVQHGNIEIVEFLLSIAHEFDVNTTIGDIFEIFCGRLIVLSVKLHENE